MHTHSKISKLIWLVGLVLLVLGGYLLYQSQRGSVPYENIDITSDEIPKGKVGMSLYENYLYSFKFEYPANLYMKEREPNTSDKSQLSIILVDGTKENIDLIEGKPTPAREGPTGVTIEVYENDKPSAPEEWAKQDSNWSIGNKQLSNVMVGYEKGVSYNWSGLYEGKSVIVTQGNVTYVFSVTWMSPEDQILKDFDMILASFSFVK